MAIFRPKQILDIFTDFNALEFKEKGFKTVLLDIDNTIAVPNTGVCDKRAEIFISNLLEHGFNVVIFSNNTKERVIKFLNGLDAKYVYYALCAYNLCSTEYKRHWTQAKEIEIPLPPLPVQEEIVRILDTFTELQAELQKELEARKEQFEYYQDLLLNKSQFSNHCSIGNLCLVKKGKTPIQKAKEGNYPLVVTAMERKSCEEYQFDANAVCIPLISSRGHGVASLNHVYYQEGKFALGNILCAVIPLDESSLKAKFLYYYIEYAKDFILVPLMKGGANVSMHCSDIEKVKIPLPSIQKQIQIISVLDKFETLIIEMTAEIEARKQQYEYYRDKLLTFKRR